MVVWATSPNVLSPPVDESPDQISTSGMKQKEDDSSSRGELSQLRQGTGAPAEASFSEKAEKDGGSAYTSVEGNVGSAVIPSRRLKPSMGD